MGHSTASGRTGGGGAAQEKTAATRGGSVDYARIMPNSRLGRAWRDAQNGDASVVVREYDADIRKETDRMRKAKNAFVKQAAQQTIDRLKEEKRRIERAFIN